MLEPEHRVVLGWLLGFDYCLYLPKRKF